MSKKMKMGHIGCGGRGNGVIKSMLGHMEFSHVCDLDAERAKTAAEAYGFKRWSTDWKELANDPEVEYISMCLPPDLNFEVVMGAASLKKPLWTEKPLDWALDPAVQMTNECKKYGTPLCVGQQYRYSDTAIAVKKLIAEGTLGTPFLGSFAHEFKGDSVYSPFINRSDRYISSGMSIHYYDLARYYLEDDAKTVFAASLAPDYRLSEPAWPKGAKRADTTCVVTVIFKKGAIVNFYCSEDIKGGEKYWSDNYQFSGDKGSVFIDTKERFPVLVYTDKAGRREPLFVPPADPEKDPGYASGANSLLLKDYLKALSTGTEPMTCAADHLKSLAIAEATYISAKSGQSVDVDKLLSDCGYKA